MKKVLSGLVSLAIMATTAGIGGSNALTSSAASTQRVRVAFMGNMSSCSAVITAMRKGYFVQQGLRIETVKFAKGPDEIAAMGSGNIDISQIGSGAHVLCAKGQAKIFAYDCTAKNDEVLGNKSKGITSIKSLKGKTVAVTLGTTSEEILKMALESAGMTEKDVNLVQMDASAAATAMIGGQIDACATWSPSTITIKQKMGSNVVSLANDLTFRSKMVALSSYICTNSYYSKNQATLKKFERAIMKAQDYRASHLTEVADWVSTYIQQDYSSIKNTVNDSEWLTSKQIYTNAKNGTLKSWYTTQMNNFVKNGSLASPVNVSSYFSTSIMTAAYEANNPKK